MRTYTTHTKKVKKQFSKFDLANIFRQNIANPVSFKTVYSSVDIRITKWITKAVVLMHS